MKCFQCQEGNQNICENNSSVTAGGNRFRPGHAHLEGSLWNGKPIKRSFNIGTISEYALVKESECVKLSSKMPMQSASIIQSEINGTSHIEIEKMRNFTSELNYPLYFLNL